MSAETAAVLADGVPICPYGTYTVTGFGTEQIYELGIPALTPAT